MTPLNAIWKLSLAANAPYDSDSSLQQLYVRFNPDRTLEVVPLRARKSFLSAPAHHVLPASRTIQDSCGLRSVVDDNWLDRDETECFTALPAWAVELTGQLIDQHLGAYPSRQYETVYGVIDRWTEIPVEQWTSLSIKGRF